MRAHNQARRLRRRVAAAAFLASAAALVAPAHAHAQASGVPRNEDRVMVAMRALPDAELKAFYLRCSRAALRQALGGTDIALCSVGYELLLTRTFQGDFHALLDWSRGQADDAGEAPSRGGHAFPMPEDVVRP
jgi:hypothetical protein